jgi:hypothetical protein
LLEDLTTLCIFYDRLDLFGCRIRFDYDQVSSNPIHARDSPTDLVLTLHALFVPLAVLLLNRLVLLNRLHELLLDEGGLLAANLAVAVGACAFPLECLDAPLEVPTEGRCVVYERVEFRRDPLRCRVVRVVK